MPDTLSLLTQHHRGPEFSDLMVQTTPGRFNEDFWSFWNQHIHPCLGDQPRLLDLGTGPGLALQLWADRYPQAHLFGVDLMPYMLEKARELLADLPQVQLLKADLHDPQLSLEPHSMDVAQSVVVLHEMIQPVRLLQTAHRLLKPGGRLMLVDWIRAPLVLYFSEEEVDQIFATDTDLELLDDWFTHFYEHNRFSADDLVWLLEHCGFQVIAQQRYKQDRFVRMAAEKV